MPPILQPFSFRTVYVNNQASFNLVGEGSLLHHVSCYPEHEIVKLLEMGINRCELLATPEERIFNAGPNIQELTQEHKFPYGSHSIKLYNCFEKFVGNIVAHIYPSDEEIKLDKELQSFASYLHHQVKTLKFHPPEKYETRADVVKVLATFIFNSKILYRYSIMYCIVQSY